MLIIHIFQSSPRLQCGEWAGKEQNWAQGDKLGNNRSHPEDDRHVTVRRTSTDIKWGLSEREVLGATPENLA